MEQPLEASGSDDATAMLPNGAARNATPVNATTAAAVIVAAVDDRRGTPKQRQR
jgi:hypothetical protein